MGESVRYAKQKRGEASGTGTANQAHIPDAQQERSRRPSERRTALTGTSAPRPGLTLCSRQETTSTRELMKDDVSGLISDLSFAIEKSMRYHQRRRGHYETCHRWIMFGVIVGPAVVALLNVPVGIVITVPAVLGALDLVWAPSHRARDHEMLFRAFSELAIKVRSETEDPQYDEWVEKRIRIEADEPPIYTALEADCDNEVRRAWGKDKQLVHIGSYHRLTMNLCRYPATHYDPRPQKALQGGI